MSVIAFLETENGSFKKNASEVASYAHAVAQKMGGTAVGIAFNATNAPEMGTYGIEKIVNVSDNGLESFNAQGYAHVIAEAVKKEESSIVVVGSSADAKYLAPLLAAKLQAGYAPNVVAVPDDVSDFTVKRTAFSNKGFAFTKISTQTKVVGVSSNAFGAHENQVDCQEEAFSPSIDTMGVSSVEIDKVTGKVSIADADIVVSGGRGLKGPENWGMVEELAEVLGAATACSKPVSDMGWRPHSEHVGQTGKPVASNLYIAIGISGAIQHLAGVSASKTKVVINNDPEAPFFKAADYGIVGDAFEVVPKLIEKLREFKAQNS
ncbi:MAG: electron transfer flavoprotein subunit alpha/FixB family protein [Flavobacteriaceae bacterium]